MKTSLTLVRTSLRQHHFNKWKHELLLWCVRTRLQTSHSVRASFVWTADGIANEQHYQSLKVFNSRLIRTSCKQATLPDSESLQSMFRSYEIANKLYCQTDLIFIRHLIHTGCWWDSRQATLPIFIVPLVCTDYEWVCRQATLTSFKLHLVHTRCREGCRRAILEDFNIFNELYITCEFSLKNKYNPWLKLKTNYIKYFEHWIRQPKN